ncbi:MAG: S-layer homology domain-containing protein [Nitriliruptoraceae bacterium]|nr:S-layer homology domain-containing protein [Nitriliruptoraceae bacterium]
MFPAFTESALVFHPDDLDYNPTGEWDFPSIFHAGAHLAEPLAEYYLYTAPHDNPGGISLFLADELDGPWIEFSGNPVIARTWGDHHDVSHVSSPHAIWISDGSDVGGQIYLYYHGENRVTRWATSTDGANFEYGGIAIDAASMAGDAREASYARVVERTIPGRENRFLMTFMDAVPGDGLGGRERRIRLATSNDARNWVVDDRPLVRAHPAEGTSVSGGFYWQFNGGHYIVYHGSSGRIFVTDVGEDFSREEHLGVLYEPPTTAPHNGRAAAPFMVEDGDRIHMFFETGRRGSTTISHSVAQLGSELRPLGPLPQLPAPEPEPAPDPEPTPWTRTFTDVASSSSHRTDIHILAANGITDGCGPWSSHTFCPDRAVTRAEMASFITRSAGLRTHTTTRFVDVRPGTSHVPGISAIDRAGYTNGCGPASHNTYCPDRPVTRAETATFLARVLDLPRDGVSTFSDVPRTSSHTGGIDAIARAGLTNGCGAPSRNTFCPDRPVTRAEMASFLVRAFELR